MLRPLTLTVLTLSLGLLGCESGSSSGSASTYGQGDHPGRTRALAGVAGDVGVEGARLAPPASIQAEHEELHEQLEAALAAEGETGEAAQAVAAVLTPHFEEEEAYALPPLGLLPALSQGQVTEEMRPAIAMAEQLRANYAQMLDEHADLVESLARLEAAAEREGHADHAAFARDLSVHAQSEEEVLYPTTLLIGEYLKLRLER